MQRIARYRPADIAPPHPINPLQPLGFRMRAHPDTSARVEVIPEPLVEIRPRGAAVQIDLSRHVIEHSIADERVVVDLIGPGVDRDPDAELSFEADADHQSRPRL